MTNTKDIPKQLYVENLSLEAIKQIEERMRPGKASGIGFLGESEDLLALIKNDAQTLEDLDISYEQIAEKLDDYMKQGFEDWKLQSNRGKDYYQVQAKGTLIEDRYRVSAVGWMGIQQCPFQEGYPTCGGTSQDGTISNEESKRSINFSLLLPHLITDHHFFEGHVTSYRLDPLEAIIVLDIPSKTHSKEEIEDKLYAQLLANLADEDMNLDHTLNTLHWFKDKAELPDELIKIFMYGGRYRTRNLIDLVEDLAMDKRSDLNSAIIALMDDIDTSTISGKYGIRPLQKFKREVEGTTHSNLINEQYWPDYVENVLSDWGKAPLVRVCVDYVESRNLLFDNVCDRLTPFWNEYLLAKRFGSDFNQTEEEYVAAHRNVKSMSNDSDPVNSIERDSPLFKQTEVKKELLEKKLEFYAAACDLSAIKLRASRLAHYLEVRAKTLVDLNRQDEAQEFAMLAIDLYATEAEGNEFTRDRCNESIVRCKRNLIQA